MATSRKQLILVSE